MPNVLIISASDATSSEPCDARLAYKTQTDDAASITASHDSSNTEKLRDGLTTQKWRPATSGTVWFQFNSEFEDSGSGATFNNVDYVGLVGVNWQTAGASVSVKDENGTEIASASGLRDNQPLYVILDKTSYSAIKFEFTVTTDALEVGEAYFGESMQFERNVKVGYQPARWTNNDIVTISRTEGNQFGSSTVRARGTTERFSFDYVSLDFMDDEYDKFINNAKGKPIFFVWNKNYQSHGVYGHWEAQEPAFTHSLYSSISLTINGVSK